MDANLQRWCRPETILLATNLHEPPSVRLAALTQARYCNAKIILAHVIHSPCFSAGAGSHGESMLPSSIQQSARTALDNFATQFQREGIRCEPVVLEGDVADQIRLVAESVKADRAIVAAGRTIGLERLVLRSVPETLACTLDVPLCVLGPDAVYRRTSPEAFRHVLVAISPEHGDFDTVRAASALAECHGASLTLLYVLDRACLAASTLSASPHVATDMLADVSHRVDANLLTRNGDFALVTLGVAAREDPDLIVLGAPADSFIARVLGTSAIHRVLQGARCPVLTVGCHCRPMRETAQSTDGASVHEPSHIN